MSTASYTFNSIDADEIRHSVASSEVEQGVHCVIVREASMQASQKNNSSHQKQKSAMSSSALEAAVRSITMSPSSSGSALPESSPKKKPQHNEFSVHAHIVRKLFEDRSGKSMRKDVAYLRVSPCGKAFESYDREKNRLVMTLSAYMELLKFFKSEYRLVCNRMDSDYKKMSERAEWISLCPSISFRGSADTTYSMVLDSSNTFCLMLIITHRFEHNRRSIMLQYTDDTMGQLSLPGSVMEEMASNQHYLESLAVGEYKEAANSKRSRQF